jgi:hypothetical protein
VKFTILEDGFEENAHAGGIDQEKRHPGDNDHVPAVENTGLTGWGWLLATIQRGYYP